LFEGDRSLVGHVLFLGIFSRGMDEEAATEIGGAEPGTGSIERCELFFGLVWGGCCARRDLASAHRDNAFDAARAIMERLKYELPVRKNET
jgi:hypothetical protein